MSMPGFDQNTIFLVTLASFVSVRAREADDRSRFLYADDPNASIILEYQLHNAPSADYSGDVRKEAAKKPPGAEYDEERHIKPYFLLPENGPRVVEFYSPWCGHCQSFKPRYIAIAREVSARLPDNEPEVNFHAVSCSVHHWVCLQNKVKRFPTIVAFKAGSAEPQILQDVSTDSIVEALNVRLNSDKLVQSFEYNENEADDAFRPVDILGASLDGLVRTREAVYKDAALSFTYALKTGVFYQRGSNDWEDKKATKNGASGPLDPMQREIFSDWIDLLYWTLPPTWILHTLINDIRNNIESVMANEENLHFMVEKHHEVVNGKHTKWSAQCSKGADGAGYPCGLWSLFHIISVGVMERHKAVLGSRNQVSTKHAAQTLRNYIDNFFGCEACRQYFVEMFDECGFDHCRRFNQPQKLPPPESWSEFAIWLWEVHNDINVKLIEAESRREGIKLSKHKLELALWPSAKECPACRNINDQWDNDAVVEHLKRAYWHLLSAGLVVSKIFDLLF